MILKSYKYCGRRHKKDISTKQVKQISLDGQKQWQRKRQEVIFIFQICIRKLYNTIKKYNYNDLEVHHIVPIKEDY